MLVSYGDAVARKLLGGICSNHEGLGAAFLTFIIVILQEDNG